MSFLDDIFGRLRQCDEDVILQEARNGRTVPVTGKELLDRVEASRSFLKHEGLTKGDRCVLLANNGIRWVAMDLAIMAEGGIAVPMYTRQAPNELAAMMRDCEPKLIVCEDDALRQAVSGHLPEAPAIKLLSDVPASAAPVQARDPLALESADPVTIIYTSGTSGVAKGVILTAGNVGHMLPCTSGRLDMLLGNLGEQERIFHYLPFCFAGSWILLLTSLRRGSLLTLSTDLERIREELKVATPHFFMNVPTLPERVRRGVEEKVGSRSGPIGGLYRMARAAWQRRVANRPAGLDGLRLGLAGAVLFRSIRKGISPNIRALVCGSAPLAEETQQFYAMLGIPVLQVYGLTETTAICTMDIPGRVVPGKVGHAIEGLEMKLAENDEIVVRGPNVFPGYWKRPDETAAVLKNGWLHTGDRGEVDADGNWRIIGRLKNLLILNSGHNIAPEPLEEKLLLLLPKAVQAVVIGNDRSYLSAIITGDVSPEAAASGIERLNEDLPDYKRIRRFHISPEPLTIESGLLTANGKLRREAIAVHFAAAIEEMYRRREP